MEVSAHDRDHTIFIDGIPGEERPIATAGGHSRKIVFANNLVIKVTTIEPGSILWDQSTNELKVWRRLRPEDRPYFAEVVDGGTVSGKSWTWVAQRYLNFEIPWTVNQVPVEVQDLIDSLKLRYGLRDFDGHYCGRNWAVANGIPVIYDYGSVDLDAWEVYDTPRS